jgi:hypothetical protein
MTYFESIGVDRQYSADSIDKANKAFANSCNYCCTQGKQINCDQCAIASVHSLIITFLNNKTA